MEQNFSNSYNAAATRRFFRRWWKLLVAVFVGAAVISGIIAFTITPLYKSTAVIFPSNSNRLSKAIMDYHYSLDFMDYGGENDCERAIQVLESRSMMEAVCQRFDLMTHYEIKADSPHRQHDLETKFASYVSAKRTDYIGIKVTVLDPDPKMAADIANFMVAYYDTLNHQIHHERAESAAEVMRDVCARMEQEIDSLSRTADGSAWKKQLIEHKTRELSDLQTRATETAIDKDLSVSYKYSIDAATVADKKDSPKRALIMLAGSLGALVVAIFGLLIFTKRDED